LFGELFCHLLFLFDDLLVLFAFLFFGLSLGFGAGVGGLIGEDESIHLVGEV